MILLAPKPHQEGVTHIKDFFWRLCVSYRGLNAVTESFTFPIPRWAASIQDFGDSNDPLFFITLDTRQGYHQIAVWVCDQEKLAFFTPDGSKKTFVVILFGPKNAPSFYTTAMEDFQQEWDADCDSQSIVDNSNPPSMVTPSTTPTHSKIVHDSRIVIDDILLYSTNIHTLIRYFSCVAKVFVRYRLSFKLSKCKFFNPCVEYLGHDLTSRGNCPAQSKFGLLKEWTLPDHWTPILSYPSLDYASSMLVYPRGLKSIWNHFGSFSVSIIGSRFQQLIGNLLSSVCSTSLRKTLLLRQFSQDIIATNLCS